MKLCSKCEKTLPKSEFVKRKDAKDGLSYHCKACVKDYKASRKAHLISYNKKWQEENKAHVLALKRKRYAEEGSKTKAYIQKYRQSPAGKFSVYKLSAKTNKRSFNLTMEQFMEFWQRPCTYCGDEVGTIGLDRVDSSVGYEVDNITSCCSECNLMKRHHSVNHFKEHIAKIYKKFSLL